MFVTYVAKHLDNNHIYAFMGKVILQKDSISAIFVVNNSSFSSVSDGIFKKGVGDLLRRSLLGGDSLSSNLHTRGCPPNFLT